MARDVYEKGSTTGERWTAFIAARQSGREVEIDVAMYWYWLEVLPPVFMNRVVHFADRTDIRADFGFREGDPGPDNPTIAFWKSNGRYFCQAIPPQKRTETRTS